MEFFLIIHWSDQHETVSFPEEADQFFSDAIFSSDQVWSALLQFERIFKVLLRTYFFTLFVFQSQGEISHKPHERRKTVQNVLFVRFRPILQHFTQVDDQAQILNCLFIDISNAVVNKVRWQKHGHEKDLGIVLFTFFQRAKAFSVHDHVLFGGVIFALNELRPYPQTFGTSIDGRADLKTVILIEKDPVKNVAFSSSVLSNDSDDTDVFLLIDFGTEPLNGLLVDRQFWNKERVTFGFLVDSDEPDRLDGFGVGLHGEAMGYKVYIR